MLSIDSLPTVIRSFLSAKSTLISLNGKNYQLFIFLTFIYNCFCQK